MTVTKTQLADAYSTALTKGLGKEWGCEFSSAKAAVEVRQPPCLEVLVRLLHLHDALTAKLRHQAVLGDPEEPLDAPFALRTAGKDRLDTELT